MTSFRLWHHLRTSMWPIPVLCVLIGVAISFATVALDSGTLVSIEFVGGPDAALAILGAIAASMIALTATVLTMVLVVVQLAMGQFSPRIVRAILHDRPSQFAIGIFVAAFAHAMLAMREIASTEEGAPVPGLAIVVAFGLVVVSIIALILYINHIGQSLRVAALIESVGNETREVLDKLYSDHGPQPQHDDPHLIVAPQSGVVFRIDYDDLIEKARDANCVLTMIPMIGDFVPAGAPLLRIEGDPEALDIGKTANSVTLGPERTLNQDVAYGFRMLVDIAERSLSDAFDPTTAVQAIDRLHDCLRQLARRPFPSGEYRDNEGIVRLCVTHITWEGYVRLAFDEIRQMGAESTQVVRRLNAALDDLMAVAPPERQGPLRRQRDLLELAVAGNAWTDPERADLFSSDPQGIGSGRDLEAVVPQA